MRTLLKSKIQGAKVTEANLHYEGSITVDADLLERADIVVGEKVEVLNLNNGARTETYAIAGKQGEVCLNGPAARLGCVGDTVIILSYAIVREEKISSLKPKVVYVDTDNRPKD